MDVSFAAGNPLSRVSDALIVPILSGNGFGAEGSPFAQLDAAFEGELSRLAADARFTGQTAKVLALPTLGRLPARRIILVGLGAGDDATAASLSKAWGAAV